MDNIIEKVSFVLPGFIVAGLVVLSSLLYNYIDKLSEPVSEEDKEKYNNAKTVSIVNLALSSVVFIFVALAYMKTMKMQRNYITYF